MPSLKILLVSPQPWGEVHISKHHYAIALVNMGHQVYFINPPNGLKFNTQIKIIQKNKNLFIVDSNFYNSLFLRYKFRKLYDYFVKKWLIKLLKTLPAFDIAWCFEANIISDLTVFKMKKIFHIVDPIDERMINTAKKADLLVCVSNRILAQFQEIKVKKIFINHGLSDHTIAIARKLNISIREKSKRLQAGYVGNLTINLIDIPLISNLIQNYPQIDFNFYGPQHTKTNLGGESSIFIESIKDFPNVFFHGWIPSNILLNSISNLDIFLIFFKPVPFFSDNSNAHKLLEYWATGKIVVSTYIDQYYNEKYKYLIQMAPENNNHIMLELFNKVVNNIEFWNSPQLMQKRREFALGFSYSFNAKTILEVLNQNE